MGRSIAHLLQLMPLSSSLFRASDLGELTETKKKGRPEAALAKL